MALPDTVEEVLPLSPVQAGMLFHAVSGGAATGAYIGVVSVSVEGPLDAGRFRAAFGAGIRARDVLRASFVYKDTKTPVQVIHRDIQLPWDALDWRDVPLAEQQARLRRLIEAERRRGIDLETAPLMRVHLIRLSERRHQLVWTIHHILSDGWSTAILLDDVRRRYAAPEDPAGAAPRTQACFRDYLVWLKRRRSEGAEAYWADHLDGIPGPTRIPVPEPPEPGTGLHRITSQTIPPAQTSEVTTLARRLRITQSSLLATCWALILRRHSGSSDVVFGVTTSGRPVDLPGVAEAVGPFVNTLPFRVQAGAGDRFGTLAQRVERLMRERALREQDALSEVVRWVGGKGGDQIFDALFVHESIPQIGTADGPLRFSGMEILGPSNYGLALVTTPGDGLRLDLYSDPSVYPSGLIDGILADLTALLAAAVRSPDAPVSTLLRAAHPIHPPDPADARTAPSVLARIGAIAASAPSAPAVADGVSALTYGELLARAGGIAAGLRAAGIGPGDVVPVAVERSVGAVAACLGVMGSGAAYVPLDLDYPAERLRQIVEATAPRVVLTGDGARDRLPPLGAALLGIDTLPSDAPMPVGDPAPETAAYVLFTSGSQGVPKGVVVPHRALSHSTFVRRDVYGADPERFLLLSSFAFDSSVAGLYWTLCTGGQLVIAPRRAERDPAALGALIREAGITHTLCLPGLHEAILGAVATEDLAGLDTVIVAGEAVAPALVERHRRLLPGCRLFNEYGPTESTVWATVLDTARWPGSGPVPIGAAIPGTGARVLDPDGVPLPMGAAGELALYGPGLAEGYLGDPERTADRFPAFEDATGRPLRVYRTGDLCHASDAGIVFSGRIDQQIKIRGHRVEPGEIESLARELLPELPCCAVAVEIRGTPQLAICIEGPEDPDGDARLARAFETGLPEHARPRHIVRTPALPRLPNRKIDRDGIARAVPAMLDEATGQTPADQGTEAELADIWSEVLGLDEIPRDGNFFDLGGDSLKTIALFAKAERKGFVLSPNDIFEHPTLRTLAAHITASAQDDVPHWNAQDLRIAHADGTQPPVFLLHGNMLLFNHLVRGLGVSRPVALQFSRHYEGGEMPLFTTIEEMAQGAVETLDHHFPQRPCVLAGFSAGAAVALEMARVLRERGRPVDLLCLVDPPLSLRKDLGEMTARRGRADRLARIGLEISKTAAASMASGLSGSAERRRRTRVNRATALAVARYTPQRHDGRTLLISTIPMDRPPDHIPNAEIVRAPFRHLDLLGDRDAAHFTAALLVSRINAARR